MQQTETPNNKVMEKKIKVLITKDFLERCEYLCKNIPKVEWSGVLVYKVKGSIKSPEKMTLTPVDIHLMDIGTAAYTEYDMDKTVSIFLMKNRYLKGYKTGHIHSHNVMNAFFSGTDSKELEDNARNHNYYFSLIVNNFNEICAKVAIHTESENVFEEKFIAKDDEGKSYQLLGQKTKRTSSKVVTYDCEITYPKNATLSVPEYFSERFLEIQKAKELKKEAFKAERFQQYPTSKIFKDVEEEKHFAGKMKTLMQENKNPFFEHNPFTSIVEEEEDISSAQLFLARLLFQRTEDKDFFSKIAPKNEEDFEELLTQVADSFEKDFKNINEINNFVNEISSNYSKFYTQIILEEYKEGKVLPFTEDKFFAVFYAIKDIVEDLVFYTEGGKLFAIFLHLFILELEKIEEKATKGGKNG